ncbi:hypothetical protein CYMTET_9164 [Cymbomonas tetramitiformis]|uniref:Uncharacterized protein n=1 Tax=Cymbomonas tetramitiformis TaxID=36881 RepID=A0AAE0GRU2_9CHLO|nr:hypothetical protein CYMTET_9164 [Cymbomonas tetramitiformis]
MSRATGVAQIDIDLDPASPKRTRVAATHVPVARLAFDVDAFPEWRRFTDTKRSTTASLGEVILTCQISRQPRTGKRVWIVSTGRKLAERLSYSPPATRHSTGDDDDDDDDDDDKRRAPFTALHRYALRFALNEDDLASVLGLYTLHCRMRDGSRLDFRLWLESCD